MLSWPTHVPVQRVMSQHIHCCTDAQNYALSEQEEEGEALPVGVMKGYSRSRVMAPLTTTAAVLDGGKW